MTSEINSASERNSDGVTQVSRDRIIELYPGIQDLAYRVVNGVYTSTRRKLNIAQGLRSFENQLSIYGQGRELQNGIWVVTDPGKVVTNAKPGLSWHCYGLAFDVSWAGADPYLKALSEGERGVLWDAYAAIGKGIGFKWGGDFHLINGVNDLPHLEMTYGLTITQAVELYEKGGIKSVWAFCDQVRGVPVGQDWDKKELSIG